MSVHNCRIIELPKVLDPRGNLTFVENNKHVPFEIKRVYYLYDVPGGETRGGHANTLTKKFIVAMSGSFDVIVDDGHETKKFSLNRAYYGLYIPNGIWRSVENFSSGGVSLVLCSTLYTAEEYIRDYDEFKKSVLK